METPILTTVVDENIHPQPIMVQPASDSNLLERPKFLNGPPRKTVSNPPTPLDSPFTSGIRPRTSTRSAHVSIPIKVETDEVKIDNLIDCPFKSHGCHKRGEKTDVKRHVRDDRNLHLMLLCQSLNPIRSTIATQQSGYINKYIEMLQKMDLIDSVFEKFNCQYTFHIPNIGIAVVKASKDKNNRTLFSQPFYSHGFGYKMMAIVAPYGDGSALREFISVFVCLMKGEYDDILEWPFRCNVTFTMKSEDHKHTVTRTFYTNEHEESAECMIRPIGLRGVAFGFQDFIPIESMNSFSPSGSLFLHVKVHLSNESLCQSKEIDSSQCQGHEIEKNFIKAMN